LLVNSIFNKDVTEIILSEKDIIFQHNKSYVYGVAINIQVGTRKQVQIKKDDVVSILLENGNIIKLVLHNKDYENIDGDVFSRYTFLEEKFSMMINNKVDTTENFLSISFEDYLENANNQLEYFIFNLRKKNLLLSINEDGITTKSHLKTLMLKDEKKIENLIYSDIEYNNIMKNFYTILDNGDVVSTKKGIGVSRFLPFSNSDDITSLDSFLVPKFELKGISSNLSLGDKIVILDEKTIVMETEIFFYKGQQTVVVTSGVEV
jgi:hypothetical protein